MHTITAYIPQGEIGTVALDRLSARSGDRDEYLVWLKVKPMVCAFNFRTALLARVKREIGTGEIWGVQLVDGEVV